MRSILIFLVSFSCTCAAFAEEPNLVIDQPKDYFLADLIPDTYILMSILITQNAARPVTKSGRVVLIYLKDPTGIIEIPWLEGKTAVESLAIWMGAR